MSYILKGIVALFKLIPRFAKFIPVGLSGIFIISQFLIIIFTQGIAQGFAYLAQSIFAAELTINQNVHLALEHSPEYNLSAFIAILVSVYVLFALIRWITKIQIKFSGAQAPWAAAIFTVVIVGFIEMATVRFIDGVFGFVPIKDGIIFLLMNLGPVLTNIHLF